MSVLARYAMEAQRIVGKWSPPPSSDDDTEAELASLSGYVFDGGSIYCVTDEMVGVLIEAQKSVPMNPLRPEDVPLEHGFVFLSTLIAYKPPVFCVGFGWRVTGNAVLAVAYGQLSEGCAPLRPLAAEVMKFGDTRENGITRLFRSFWALSRQRIVASAPGGDRPMARQLQRANLPVPEIRILTLRRPLQPDAGGEGGNRDWRFRWAVSGHWRNQYFPSREDHEPVWVESYVKGPADRPFDERTTVRLLRR